MKTTAALSALLLLIAPGAALAHAHLHTAAPAPDARDVAAPTKLALTFSEPVTKAFSGAELVDAAGKRVKLGEPSLADGGRTLAIPIAAPVRPGAYTVRWHVVSADTHRMKGDYRFTVR